MVGLMGHEKCGTVALNNSENLIDSVHNVYSRMLCQLEAKSGEGIFLVGRRRWLMIFLIGFD